jgi:hypothetical protein
MFPAGGGAGTSCAIDPTARSAAQAIEEAINPRMVTMANDLLAV